MTACTKVDSRLGALLLVGKDSATASHRSA